MTLWQWGGLGDEGEHAESVGDNSNSNEKDFAKVGVIPTDDCKLQFLEYIERRN